MINEIEDAIVALIKEKVGDAAGRIAVQKGVEGIPQPAVYVSTEAGRFEKATFTSFRHELTIYVDIVFSYRGADDASRRKGIYQILEGILRTLIWRDMGLAIKPLVPKNWKNTTVEEMRQQGLLAFSLELATAYTITQAKDEETAAADLLAVGLNYYLTPGDDIADAVDLVTLSGE
ncbi:phage protein Gp37 [Desulfobulbus sp.]|uniref:phage protein Gp37 n=1 Tax=Desulfobulbus sp. TaxID=895 RepID=UPI00286EECAA|nr:phage protein Gp37 [Desulfobulbus sp.]